MADDEQFSLCWNNFNTNLSAGFHESLCRGDLVDVTLAAEGQFVKAHRLVLSVCSPYFRKMFTQMPSNQHAFVFLKDVSHTALKDLIQFMYCGEVNVKQEALPAFISTAEALQIKGLTDSDPPPPPPQQQTIETAAPAPPTTQIHNVSNTPPRTRHRTTTRTYKLETIDADEDDQTQTKAPQTTQIVIQTAAAPSATISTQQQQLHQVVQGASVPQITTVAAPAASSSSGTVVTTSQKRTLRTSGGPNLKRTKNSSTTTTSVSMTDPLDTASENVSSQPQQITAIVTTAASSDKNQSSASTDTEYIDLPIEIPTKSEPDYTEEAAEAEGADAEGTYGEDDSYGEMRYDDTYFTENEDGGNATTGGGTSTSATTSKTVMKQQQSSFSDSSFTPAADAGEQTNNDTQVTEAVADAKIPKPLRKRGRPKIREDAPPQQKLMEKLASACRRHPGQPTVYASTTKGAMKLIYDGHHFRYSFRKGQFSIFQCCYKENKEECRVRVVSDQKRVYPLDGEHTHFIQATDKSVTSVSFEPGDANERVKTPTVETSIETKTEEPADYEIEEYMIAVGDDGVDDVIDEKPPTDEAFDANDFREKIKKRLQKALLGKKK